jgi:hypothetical protein
MTYTNGILPTFIERKEETRSALVLRSGRRRAADLAMKLSKHGAAAATAELCNEAVCKLIELLYQPDTDGLIPAPWGSVGRPCYGLRRTEGDTLRRYVQFLETLDRPVRLFFFEGQRWHLNLWDYSTVEKAMNYWRLVQMDVAAWKRFGD